MAPRTIYCAQTYVRRRDGLSAGQRYSFDSGVEAEDAGRDLSRAVDGVIVFLQEGDPDFDVWDDPIILARHGRTPRIEF